MSGAQLLDTLRNKLLCTLTRLRQQIRLTLRACDIRLHRTVRAECLLTVPQQCSIFGKKNPADGRRGSKFRGSTMRGTEEACAPHPQTYDTRANQSVTNITTVESFTYP